MRSPGLARKDTDSRTANALDRLAAAMSEGARVLANTRVSGVVTEIATSHYRVAGLSRFVRLGECVKVEVGDKEQIGEVVRIEDGRWTDG